MPHFLRPLLRSDHPHGLLIERTQSFLADRIEPAFDSRSRKNGLLGRSGLSDGHAIVIAPSQAVHTIGMRFPIDIVGVNRDGRVVKMRERVGAWRIMVAWSAFAIVELSGGSCARAGVRVGDRLIVARRGN